MDQQKNQQRKIDLVSAMLLVLFFARSGNAICFLCCFDGQFTALLIPLKWQRSMFTPTKSEDLIDALVVQQVCYEDLPHFSHIFFLLKTHFTFFILRRPPHNATIWLCKKDILKQEKYCSSDTGPHKRNRRTSLSALLGLLKKVLGQTCYEIQA